MLQQERIILKSLDMLSKMIDLHSYWMQRCFITTFNTPNGPISQLLNTDVRMSEVAIRGGFVLKHMFSTNTAWH